MEKENCLKDFENGHLEMSDEKCNNCPLLYECRFMAMEMDDIVNGN